MKKILFIFALSIPTFSTGQTFDFNKQPVDSCIAYKKKLEVSMEKVAIAESQLNSIKLCMKICKKKPAEKATFYEKVTAATKTTPSNIALSIPTDCTVYKKKLDSVKHILYMDNKQLNTVKYYIKICEKKPTNKKFFYGWVTNRAIKK